jgi:hypothetical protein
MVHQHIHIIGFMKHITIFLMVIMICVVPVRVVAQLCNIIPETITTYPRQAFGNYNLWDASYGEVENVEAINSGFMIDEKHMMLVGNVQDDPRKITSLILTKIDRRGRKVSEKRHDAVEGLSSIKTVLRDEDAFWVLGDVQKDSGQYYVWLGKFGLDGEMLLQKSIQEAGHNTRAGDIVFAHGASRYESAKYVIGVNIQKFITPSSGPKSAERQTQEQFQSRLLFVDKALKTIGTRTYALGVNNKIFDMAPLDNGAYALTGQVKAANGLQSGWLMIVSRDGGIQWQREFSRGAFSRFNTVTSYLNNHIIVGGLVHSAHKNTPSAMMEEDAGAKTDAAWVMAISAASGKIVWQRYFTSAFDYAVRDIHTLENGMIHALISSDGLDVFKMSEDEIQQQITDNAAPDYQHAVVVSMSPRGAVLDKASYFDGVGAVPSSMFIFDHKYPMFVGQSVTVTYNEAYQDTAEPRPIYSPDGWAMMGGALNSYNDPCR